MLRITAVAVPDGGQCLYLEGRLAGAWNAEFSAACKLARRPLYLDLSAVQFVDNDGVALLQGVVGEGACIAGSSPFVKALLENVSSTACCRR